MRRMPGTPGKKAPPRPVFCSRCCKSGLLVLSFFTGCSRRASPAMVAMVQCIVFSHVHADVSYMQRIRTASPIDCQQFNMDEVLVFALEQSESQPYLGEAI